MESPDTTYCLTVLDTSGIQPYVFGSNRLKENMGASELVFQATSVWPAEILIKLNYRTNLTTSDNSIDSSQQIENNQDLDAEILYLGGGNALIIFREEAKAKEFARNYSLKLLQTAPGLTVHCVHTLFKWSDPLSQKIKEAFSELFKIKNNPDINLNLPGIGITAPCRSTGAPASFIDHSEGKEWLVSAEIKAKLDYTHQARKRLKDVINDFDLVKIAIDFTDEFDELGRTKGDSSYLAVVHCDGNGMGQTLYDIQEAYPRSEQNRDYIQALRNFSDSLDKGASKAFRNMLKRLLLSLEFQDGKMTIKKKFNLGIKKDGNWALPLLPLVFGGDDLLFVCDGRIALDLTTYYLEEFEKINIALPNNKTIKPASCAGIAIIKTHYPFSRAYQLAETLCGSAKKFARAQSDYGSALDWEIARTGIHGSLSSMRKRYSQLAGGECLYQRPLLLHDMPGIWNNWDSFKKCLIALSNRDKYPHNKLKGLMEVFRRGKAESEDYIMNVLKEDLPDIAGNGSSKSGWFGNNTCVYFDALEIEDFFLSLDK